VFIVYVIVAAFGIGILILAHEFGHFIVAKLCNVKVERFSIGFGPEIFGFTRGETRYSLRWVPLGGYVKMMGDEPGSEESSAARSFLAQSFSRKAAIIVAGSMMNIIMSLVFFIAVFQIGVELPTARVGLVAPGYPAYYAGLATGDRIVSMDGWEVLDFNDLMVGVLLSDPGDALKVQIERNGERLERTLYPIYVAEAGVRQIGVNPYESLTIGAFMTMPAGEGDADTKPALTASETAGLEAGWTITALNGESVASWYDFERSYYTNGLKPFALTATKDGVEKTFNVTPEREEKPALGVYFGQGAVESVEEDSLAAKMGLAKGDVLAGLGSMETADVLHIKYEIARLIGDVPPLVVMRSGETMEIAWPDETQPTELFDGLTLEEENRVAWVMPESPADIMGITTGAKITSIDGAAVEDTDNVRELLAAAEGDTIAVSWEIEGVVKSGSFSPVLLDFAPMRETALHKLGLAGACSTGMKKALGFAMQIYDIIRKAVSGQKGIAKSLGGPLTIARFSYQVAAQNSPTRFVLFLAIISINLGIMNLLPIPVLDGGHLAMFAVEKIKGSPLSLNVQAAVQYVGLAIIILLFLFVTYNDILRLFS
jgi:regulator of sigma E protease